MLSGVWGLAAWDGCALIRLMVLRFQRPPDNRSTNSHLSPGDLEASGLIGEWL